MKNYGKELILDLHDCDVETFTRESIEEYFIALCLKINMTRCELVFWDDLETPEAEKQTSPHTVGTSAVQFILTSSIVVHTLDKLGKAFINIFSCKDFNSNDARDFTHDWFHGKVVQKVEIDRL